MVDHLRQQVEQAEEQGRPTPVVHGDMVMMPEGLRLRDPAQAIRSASP
jgi:hypothetical protein